MNVHEIEYDPCTGRTVFNINDPRERTYGTPRKESMLRLATEAPQGCFVELGVYRGDSAWRLADLAVAQHRACHLFDTFTGIPESGEFDPIPIGAMSDVRVEDVRQRIPSAIFHVGIFPDTFPAVFEPIAFVHIDCDQYHTCCEAIDRFVPLMVEGGIMLFDDFNVTPGVQKAVLEKISKVEATREGKAYFVKRTT